MVMVRADTIKSAFDLHGNKSSIGVGSLQFYRREREDHIARANRRDEG
jgi:hypothetical protein